MSEPIVIVSAARTPIGSLNGSLSSLSASALGQAVIMECIKRAKVDPADVSEVIMGQTLTAGGGQNPARQASMNSGIPYTVPAFTVNQLCGSGLKAIFLGYQSIQTGDSKIVVCGGQESMSQAPHYVHIRSSVRMGNITLTDSMLNDGLTDAFDNVHMGITAENIASEHGISRAEQDKFSTASQKKAEEALKDGHFRDEIVKIEIKTRKGVEVVDSDEFPRPGTTEEKLAALKPVFKKDGTVTAGNAAGINDGAAAVLLMSLNEAKKYGCTPMAKILAFAQVGIDPKFMGLGPINAIKKLLEKVGWEVDDVDLFELNEAFAAQSIAVIQNLGIKPSKVNVSGGAIALGHPIGASGARILITLLYALRRTNSKRGVAALCIGGGMGIAVAVELMS
ncbi:acetyl-CoA acetyltransferase, cytosolic [Cimex lectularius]|uniref:Acetyl-CoA acetyltransferase n=1 Tax=Cimex lectularius TaxID=79782 RepID=A0A8I6S0X9_CIMLE|nr:acetyl-CoA acetyltransferase, cytosolic [Cimex lectularius]